MKRSSPDESDPPPAKRIQVEPEDRDRQELAKAISECKVTFEFEPKGLDDFRLVIGKNLFKVHRAIVAKDSTVFRDLFLGDPECNGLIVTPETFAGIPSRVDHFEDDMKSTFEFFFYHIYNEQADIGTAQIEQLLHASHYFDTKKLLQRCRERFLELCRSDETSAIALLPSLIDCQLTSWVIGDDHKAEDRPTLQMVQIARKIFSWAESDDFENNVEMMQVWNRLTPRFTLQLIHDWASHVDSFLH